MKNNRGYIYVYATFIIALIGLIAPNLSYAKSQKLPEEFARKILQQHHIEKFGHIDYIEKDKLDDGREYYIIKTIKKEDDELQDNSDAPDLWSFYLFIKENNGKITKISNDWGCLDYRGTCSVETSGNSIYFSNGGSGGVCSLGFEIQQFKMINGEFQLVGVENSSARPFIIEKSINFLTNRLIIRYHENKEEIKFPAKIPKHHEQTFSLHSPKKWLLKDMKDYESWFYCATATNVDDISSTCTEEELTKLATIRLKNSSCELGKD